MACTLPYILLNVLQRLLQQFLFGGGQPSPSCKPVDQHGRLLLTHPHHQHEDQQVMEDDTEKVVFLETKFMLLFVG